MSRAHTRTPQDGEPRCFRATGRLVAGWVWMAITALNLVDLAVRGRDLASVVAAAVLLFGCALAYVLLLRPRIVADPHRLRVVNPLRTFTVPWPAVHRVELRGTIEGITVVTGETPIRAFTLQVGRRPRRRRGRGGLADPVADRTHTDFVVEQLNELAAMHGRARRQTGTDAAGAAPEQPSVAWAAAAIAALAATGVFLAGALIVALV